jgi:hypothetical protein
MELQDVPQLLRENLHALTTQFQRIPGSAMLIRYVQSSYQDDPVRSAIELVLVLFFVRYLLAPSYSTKEKGFVKLSEEVSSGPRRGCDGDAVGGEGLRGEDDEEGIEE